VGCALGQNILYASLTPVAVCRLYLQELLAGRNTVLVPHFPYEVFLHS
jgi:hypothetical protein